MQRDQRAQLHNDFCLPTTRLKRRNTKLEKTTQHRYLPLCPEGRMDHISQGTVPSHILSQYKPWSNLSNAWQLHVTFTCWRTKHMSPTSLQALTMYGLAVISSWISGSWKQHATKLKAFCIQGAMLQFYFSASFVVWDIATCRKAQRVPEAERSLNSCLLMDTKGLNRGKWGKIKKNNLWNEKNWNWKTCSSHACSNAFALVRACTARKDSHFVKIWN